MTGSRQQTPTDRLEEIRREHADMGRIERERYAGDFVWELLETALAQRDVVAAALHLASAQFTGGLTAPENWRPLNAALDALDGVAAVVSGTPPPEEQQ